MATPSTDHPATDVAAVDVDVGQASSSAAVSFSDGPFTVILLDGDRDIFRMDLVNEGFAGGIRAAAALFDSTRTWLKTQRVVARRLRWDTPIFCYVFLNRVGLGNFLELADMIDSFEVVQAFIRGFVNSPYPFYMMDTADQGQSADKQIHREVIIRSGHKLN
ncbi:hypothetical protein RQP46_006752 [Phenoliferia psychrophenolica]